MELKISKIQSKANSGLESIQTEQRAQSPQTQKVPNIHFSLKITDISEIRNPFVIFDKRSINTKGFIFLNEKWIGMTAA